METPQSTVQPNRRSFLRSIFTTIPAAAILSVPVIGSAVLGTSALADHHAPAADPDSLNDEKETSSNSDAVYSREYDFENGSSLHNMGIRHSKEGFLAAKDGIDEAIQTSDMILLERRSTSWLNIERYIMEKFGKEVSFIEEDVSQIPETSMKIWTMIAGALGIYNIAKHRDLAELQSAKRWTRRELFGLFATTQSVFPLTLLQSMAEPDNYPETDISYVVDDRTLKMTKRLLDVANLNPGKRLLSITGRIHAKGIEQYINDPAKLHSRESMHEILHPFA
ncbi:MAG: hypothetical protein WC873_01605 [Candidatus Gracilibacteria bacterium]